MSRDLVLSRGGSDVPSGDDFWKYLQERRRQRISEVGAAKQPAAAAPAGKATPAKQPAAAAPVGKATPPAAAVPAGKATPAKQPAPAAPVGKAIAATTGKANAKPALRTGDATSGAAARKKARVEASAPAEKTAPAAAASATPAKAYNGEVGRAASAAAKQKEAKGTALQQGDAKPTSGESIALKKKWREVFSSAIDDNRSSDAASSTPKSSDAAPSKPRASDAAVLAPKPSLAGDATSSKPAPGGKTSSAAPKSAPAPVAVAQAAETMSTDFDLSDTVAAAGSASGPAGGVGAAGSTKSAGPVVSKAGGGLQNKYAPKRQSHQDAADAAVQETLRELEMLNELLENRGEVEQEQKAASEAPPAKVEKDAASRRAAATEHGEPEWTSSELRWPAAGTPVVLHL